MPTYTNMSPEIIDKWKEFFLEYCDSIKDNMSLADAAYLVQSTMELFQAYSAIRLEEKKRGEKWKRNLTATVSTVVKYLHMLQVKDDGFYSLLSQSANNIRHKAYNCKEDVRKAVDYLDKNNKSVTFLLQNIFNTPKDYQTVRNALNYAIELYGDSGRLENGKEVKVPCFIRVTELLSIVGFKSKYSVGEAIEILKQEGYGDKEIYYNVCNVLSKEYRYSNDVIKDGYK